MAISEEFLSYIWKYRLFKIDPETVDIIEVLHPGSQNFNAGPDFFNAKIRINGTTWAGNVEIHIRSSDWFRHNHHNDPVYENVVLHVVYENDRDVTGFNNRIIPVIELKNKFNPELLERYSKIAGNLEWLPCGKQINTVDPGLLKCWLQRIFVERMECQTDAIIKRVTGIINNWEQAFYEWLAAGFGFKTNKEAFFQLARQTPCFVFPHNKGNRFVIESLLFGQSGLLGNQLNEEYPCRLQKEYKYLSKKYDLKPINAHLWRFMRIRPSGFPTIRLSQFACLLTSTTNLFSEFINAGNISDLSFLYSLTASEYWNDHYRFGVKSPFGVKRLGISSVNTLLINTVIPFLFVYGKERNEYHFIDKALNWMEQLPPEDNKVVRKFDSLGIVAESALESQALLHLLRYYCEQKKCLFCSVGLQIIKGK